MKLYNLWFTIKSFKNFYRYLNRRAEIESVLLDAANGKRDMLTKQECRELAFKLAGVIK